MQTKHFLGFIGILLLTGCYTLTLKDLRTDSIHTTKTFAGDYAKLGVCLSRWLDENTSGGRVPRHFPEDHLYQIQGLRGGSGFHTLVELKQTPEGMVQVDTYVAHDIFLLGDETITERLFRGLGSCVS